MKEGKIKALFPEGVETITISKNDYDRLYGEMTYQNIFLQERIDKAIEYIELWHYRNDYRVNSFTTECKNDLLNILQGKDENK